MRSRLLTTLRRDDDAGLVYLLRDEFITAEAAPIASPRTCEPGPGQFLVTDTGNLVSISGGALTVGNGTYGDPVLFGDAITRSDGVAILASATAVGIVGYQNFGWMNDLTMTSAAGADHEGNFRFSASTTSIYCEAAFIPMVIAADTQYSVALILRAAGIFLAVKGGAFADWTLLYVSTKGTSSTLYPAIGCFSSVADYDTFAVVGLSTSGYPAWSGDGIATHLVASPANGEAATMPADGFVEVTWTPSAGETLDLMIRRTNDTAAWSVVCAEATAANPNTIKTIERNAGDTERATAAQTFNAGSSYRILVGVYGQRITAWVNESYKTSYASAAFNSTATGVKLSGSSGGANLIVWPSDVSAYLPESF